MVEARRVPIGEADPYLLFGLLGKQVIHPGGLVLPGHVSEPTPFDGRLLATTIGEIRDNVALARLTEAEFVEAVLARIPPSPPNHALIVELNERGELPLDPAELEAGANRCAVS
jgi:hypothetical protein